MSEIFPKEKTKAEQEKAAIAAMKATSAHMELALSRIERLENAVNNFSGLIDDMLKHIPQGSYHYDSRDSNHDRFLARKTQYINYCK